MNGRQGQGASLAFVVEGATDRVECEDVDVVDDDER
jgi:hypothetical protein